jgi:hypothetical protein
MESSQCENLDHLFCRKVWSAGLHCQFIYIKWNKCFCSYFLLLNLKVCYEIFWHLNRRWCKYSFFILDNQTLRSIHTWTSISVYQYIHCMCWTNYVSNISASDSQKHESDVKEKISKELLHCFKSCQQCQICFLIFSTFYSAITCRYIFIYLREKTYFAKKIYTNTYSQYNIHFVVQWRYRLNVRLYELGNSKFVLKLFLQRFRC